MDELWSEEHGRKIFAETMPLSRFKKIRSNLRFDNTETRQARLARDKLAAIRLLLDVFIDNSQTAFVLSESVTVDEQLYPYQGRCPFTQCMPSKPSKYGIKFWVLCDSESFYCFNIHLYRGKTDRLNNVSLGEHVVMNMAQFLFGKGRNVTTDNFFTSLALARKLKEKQLTLVGTIRKTRKEVPKEFLNHRARELYSSNFVFTALDSIQLVFYKTKASKMVILLSSEHKDAQIINGEKKKPCVIHYYNSTKGGVDAMNERVGT